MGKTVVIATRITAGELERLDNALLGPLKGSYSNRAEFLSRVLLLALDNIEKVEGSA